MIFFFKQKTAYDVRISDWSSDVCSSDLQYIIHSPRLKTSVEGARASRMSLERPLAPSPRPHQIANWLLAIAALVFLMVVVGGITRLTESGLSLTRWDPISGVIPQIGIASCRERVCQYV